jgi:hypothetical protein
MFQARISEGGQVWLWSVFLQRRLIGRTVSDGGTEDISCRAELRTRAGRGKVLASHRYVTLVWADTAATSVLSVRFFLFCGRVRRGKRGGAEREIYSSTCSVHSGSANCT